MKRAEKRKVMMRSFFDSFCVVDISKCLPERYNIHPDMIAAASSIISSKLSIKEKFCGEKLNILCLHGKSQNKEVFRTRLGRIPHKCKDVAVFYCDVEAPHDLPLVEGGIL